MAGQEKILGSATMAHGEKDKGDNISKKVSDHLANERTFLAWIRTGLATITFGFVVERFGLVLRELKLTSSILLFGSVPFSAAVGIALTFLGVGVIIVALLNFLHTRTAIDAEAFRPATWFAVLLTVLASVIGLLLAVYLIVSV
jgi:putative membrane protein